MCLPKKEKRMCNSTVDGSMAMQLLQVGLCLGTNLNHVKRNKLSLAQVKGGGVVRNKYAENHADDIVKMQMI